MALRDHFHPPVANTHSWDEVHGGWPMEIVRSLRGILRPGFRAGPNVHLSVVAPELHVLLPLEASYEETCSVLGIE